MGIKKYNPVTPGQRFKTGVDTKDLSKGKPLKRLVRGKSKTGGRGYGGKITMRHRGGGHKRRYRFIDFLRKKEGVEGRVAGIEYDPNRSARIALVVYRDGDKRYILAPEKLKVGMRVNSGEDVKILVGYSLPLRNIPLGSFLHNIELYPGRGGQLVRSAGVYAQLMARDGNYCHVKLPSGEVRKIFGRCRATVGVVGNSDHGNISLGKAGRGRWMGRRPKVRGVAMNPVDHPHGGGEGKTSGGRHPVSRWGKPAKGHRTRKLNNISNRLIIKRRNKKSGR